MTSGVMIERLLDRLDEIEGVKVTREQLLAIYDELLTDEPDEEPTDDDFVAGDEAEPLDFSPPPAPPRRR